MDAMSIEMKRQLVSDRRQRLVERSLQWRRRGERPLDQTRTTR